MSQKLLFTITFYLFIQLSLSAQYKYESGGGWVAPVEGRSIKTPKDVVEYQSKEVRNLSVGWAWRFNKLTLKETKQLPELLQNLEYIVVQGVRVRAKDKEIATIFWNSLLEAPKLNTLELVEVDFEDFTERTYIFNQLPKIKHLKKLSIKTDSISQELIMHLSQLKELEVLHILSNKISADFSPLTQIETLVFSPKEFYDTTNVPNKLPKQLKTFIPYGMDYTDFQHLLGDLDSLNYLYAKWKGEDEFILKESIQRLELKSDFLPSPSQHLHRLSIETNSYYRKARTPYYLNKRIIEFSNLKELYLSEDKPTILPKEFYQLENLEILSGWINELSDSIQYLTGLKRLEINGNITNLPERLGKLQGLEELQITTDKMKVFPEVVYQLKGLKEMRLLTNHKQRYLGKHFRKLEPKRLGELTGLEHLGISLSSLPNRANLRKIYKAIPDSTQVTFDQVSFKPNIEQEINLGLHTQYHIGGYLMSGLELNYHFAPWKIKESFVKKGRFGESAKQKYQSYNTESPFDFHTLSFGVDWNYSKNFLMGYKLSYTYTAQRFPFAVQTDLAAYTNYKQYFDFRITPKVGVPINLGSIYLYIMYGYSIPVLSQADQAIMPNHNITINMRIVSDWPGIPIPLFVF